MSDEENDTPQLSREALNALQEFYTQQAEKDSKLKSIIENQNQDDGVEATFEEDWQLSQFWYDDTTSEVLAKEALRVAGPTGKIALISCPTLYNRLKRESKNAQVTLFEYDGRFAAYGDDFVFYDYNSPLDVPRDLAGGYDVVVADPPFLSEECLTKTAVTMKFLAKNEMILCTGAVMEELAKRLLNLNKAGFEPRHRNNLANEFSCFSNYNMDQYIVNK